MTIIFKQSEIDGAVKLRKKMLTLWLIGLGVYLAAVIAMFTVFALQVEIYHDRALQTPFMTLSIILTLGFAFFSIAFFGTKYRMTKAYCKMYEALRTGRKEQNKGTVVALSRDLMQKDGVWFYSVDVECAPLRREQVNIRKLLIEQERPTPDMAAGDRIEFIAHSSILIAYKNLSKEA